MASQSEALLPQPAPSTNEYAMRNGLSETDPNVQRLCSINALCLVDSLGIYPSFTADESTLTARVNVDLPLAFPRKHLRVKGTNVDFLKLRHGELERNIK
jgi:hypothetical protein